MQTSVAPRAIASATLRTTLIGMIVRVGFPALALEAAELASDEADIREVDVAIDDVGDFVADILGAREIGAFHDRAQIVAGRGVKQQAFFGREFLVGRGALERGAHLGRGFVEQGAERRRFDFVDPVSPYFDVHD